MTKEKNRKSQEVRDDVKELIDKLVALEYQNEEMNRKAQYCPLPNEDELLGFNKFKQPNFHMPNSKKETENFEKKVHEDIHKSLFGHENYLRYGLKFDPDEIINRENKFKDSVNTCNCLSSGSKYSQCS